MVKREFLQNGKTFKNKKAFKSKMIAEKKDKKYRLLEIFDEGGPNSKNRYLGILERKKVYIQDKLDVEKNVGSEGF